MGTSEVNTILLLIIVGAVLLILLGIFFSYRKLKNLSNEYIQSSEIVREKEKLLSLFIENAPAAIAMFDREMRYIGLSKRWKAAYGLGDTELIGRSHYDVFPEISEHWKEIHRRCLKGAIERNEEDLFIRSGGIKQWVRWEIRPWYKTKGDIGGIIIFSEEITHQKEIEEQLRDAILVRDEFLSIASHELKTPLTALNMQLQLIKRVGSEEKVSHPLLSLTSAAFQSGQKLNKLIDQLLDITRIRAGKLVLNKQEVDLKASAITGVSDVLEEARRKGVQITVRADQDVVGSWDSIRINQIVANLLSNALKYGLGKPIEVTVTVDQTKRIARLLVQDQGTGIPLNMQSKIFERYERIGVGAKVGGLGLGLYIVRQIVEAHGGSIHVESDTGKGSLFIVELPIKAE